MQWYIFLFVAGALFFFFLPRLGAMSVEEASQLIREGTPLVDVRTVGEFQQQSVPGSVNIPLDQLGDLIGQTGYAKDQPILVFCRSGNRSGSAKRLLEQMGYTQVKNLGAFGNAEKAASLSRQAASGE